MQFNTLVVLIYSCIYSNLIFILLDTSTDSFEESDTRDELVSKDTSCPQETVDEDETMSPTVNESKPVCPLVLHGDPLTDRKSTFQAHVAQVHTTNQVSYIQIRYTF